MYDSNVYGVGLCLSGVVIPSIYWFVRFRNF